jgi:hypothetical protein
MNMHYLKAIDLVCDLNFDPEETWKYCAEIDATSKLARIAVYDEENVKLGYLGEFDIIKTEVVTV